VIVCYSRHREKESGGLEAMRAAASRGREPESESESEYGGKGTELKIGGGNRI
jgi:hypothetical protein